MRVVVQSKDGAPAVTVTVDAAVGTEVGDTVGGSDEEEDGATVESSTVAADGAKEEVPASDAPESDVGADEDTNTASVVGAATVERPSVGEADGTGDGKEEGGRDGVGVGEADGLVVGTGDGDEEGRKDGTGEGEEEGANVLIGVGDEEGAFVVGANEGSNVVGDKVGLVEGGARSFELDLMKDKSEGEAVGDLVSLAVGEETGDCAFALELLEMDINEGDLVGDLVG